MDAHVEARDAAGVAYRVTAGDRTLAVVGGCPGDGGPAVRNVAVGRTPGRSTPGPTHGLPGSAWMDVLADDPDALVVLRRPDERSGCPVPDGVALPDEVYVPAGDGPLPDRLAARSTPVEDGAEIPMPEGVSLRARAVDAARSPTRVLDLDAGDRRAFLAGSLPRGLPQHTPARERVVEPRSTGDAETIVERVERRVPGPTPDCVFVGEDTHRTHLRRFLNRADPLAVHVAGGADAGHRDVGDRAERLVRSARGRGPNTHVTGPWGAPVAVELGGDELVVSGRERARLSDAPERGR